MPDPTDNVVTLEEGSKDWLKWRKLATVPEPGQRSALWFLTTRILGLEPLIPMTIPAHYSMCLFAERATGIPEIDEARIQLIQVPRGFGKSAIITKGIPIMRLISGYVKETGIKKDYSVGIANEKQELANAFLAQIKLEFESNQLLQVLFPEVIPKDFRKTTWAADRIVLERERPRPTSPSVLAAGVGATVTGVHVDEWIVDDPISQNAAENALRGSFSEIEATNRWFNRLEPLLCSPKRDKITVIGTPWWVGDTYHYIEGTERQPGLWGHGEPLQTFLWTLRLPNGTSQTLTLYKRGEMAIYRRPAIHNGRSIFPERWNLEELQMIERQDPAFYQANYMLAPAEGADSAFKMEWLKEYEWDATRNNIRYKDELGKLQYVRTKDLTTWISIDPAFSKRSNAAKTAIAVVGSDGKRFFLLEDFAEKGIEADAIGWQAAQFAQTYRPQMIFLETIVAQRVLVKPLKSALEAAHVNPIPFVHEIASHGRQSKELRIYGLQPWFRAGQFYIHPSHVNFKDEYAAFPRGSQRDFLDALSFQIEPGWQKLEQMTGSGSMTGADDYNTAALARYKNSLGKGGGY